MGILEGQAIEWCQLNFITTNPGCHGNKIWDKIGYNSACVRDISKILAPGRVFRDWLLNDVRKILLWLTPVAMAMKFQTKLAITKLVWEISQRSLHLTGGFLGHAIKWCQSNIITTDPGCHGNKIWDKIVNNSAYVGNPDQILVPSREFSSSCYQMMSDKFYHDWPLLPWQRNFRQSAITRLIR